MPDPLAPRQRQTHAARQAFAGKFSTPEARSEYFRELSRKSAARRVVLTGDEVEALAKAYALLRGIAERASLPAPANALPENEVTAGGEPAVGEAA